MAAFKDAISAAMGVWFSDDIADTVTYTTKGEDPAQIPALIDLGENLELQVERDAVGACGVLEVRVTDVANPQYGDQVTFSGDTWTVIRVLAGDGYTWRLEIERDVRSTFTP